MAVTKLPMKFIQIDHFEVTIYVSKHDTKTDLSSEFMLFGPPRQAVLSFFLSIKKDTGVACLKGGSIPKPIQSVLVDSSFGVIEKYLLYEDQYSVYKCITIDNILQD